MTIPYNVAELVIGRRQRGLHRTYDRHTYRSEKARALESLFRWSHQNARDKYSDWLERQGKYCRLLGANGLQHAPKSEGILAWPVQGAFAGVAAHTKARGSSIVS
jgi:hypothetical protein